MGLNVFTGSRRNKTVYVYQLDCHRLGSFEMKHPGSRGSHAYNGSVLFLHEHIHTVYWRTLDKVTRQRIVFVLLFN